MKKRLWPISSRIIEQDKRQKQLIRVHKVTWHLMLKLKAPFFMTQGVAENINFWKKRQPFRWRKDFNLFFLALSILIILRNNSKGSKKDYNNYCWSYKIFFLGPRMLKTNIFEKKAISPVKKSLWPISSRIIEHGKRQGTTYMGPQGKVTINVEVIRPFLLDPRGCWKHKFLKNKAIFPVKKRFSPISSRIIEHDKGQGTAYKVPQGNLTINVEVIRPFLHDPRGCWKHKFLKKKAIFPVKRFWPTSSRLIEHDERPETTYKGPQGNLTFNVEVKSSLLYDPRGCWKHKFLKKKANFPVKKRF